MYQLRSEPSRTRELLIVLPCEIFCKYSSLLEGGCQYLCHTSRLEHGDGHVTKSTTEQSCFSTTLPPLHSFHDTPMPHYIRFLKVPQVSHVHDHFEVSCVITIVTDLGDTFFNDHISLTARLVPKNGPHEICATHADWSQASRECSVTLKCSVSHFSSVQVHLSTRPKLSSDHKLFKPIPLVLDAWSAPFDLTARSKATAFVERKISSRSGTSLSIWEETGDSIAHHIWYARTVGVVIVLNHSGMLL